jgi:hypothetical protein
MAAASNRITAVYCVFWGGMMNPNFRLHEATLQSFLHHYHLTRGAQLQQSSLELRPITSTCRNLPFAKLNPAAGHGIGVRDGALRPKRRRTASPPHRASFRDWSRSCGMSCLCNGTNPSRLPVKTSTVTEPRGPIRAFAARERCPWSRARP